VSWKRILKRRLGLDSYNIAALLMIIAAVTLRVVLVALGWPPLDSDEATMGIMGMHIAFHGEWPIFFYGQGYMGAFEAYLAAIMFRLFGVSMFTLLIGLILMYTIFLIAMYRLSCLLYSKALALVALLFLCLGSNAMLTRELLAIGGYPETLLFGSLLMLLAAWLAVTSKQNVQQNTTSERWRRFFAFSAWGLVAGLGLWTHVLVAPFALVSGLLILIFCWRELLGWPLIGTFVCLVIGLLPMIIYNVNAAPGQDTLSYLLTVHNASATGIILPPRHILIPMQIREAFLVSLPTATGLTPLCAPHQIQLLHWPSLHVMGCTVLHVGWASGVVALWLLAVAFVVRRWLLARTRSDSATEARATLARQMAHLALLLAAAMTFFLYVISPDAALFPIPTSRYLIGLLIAIPAVLWPLWQGANVVKPLVLGQSKRHVVTLHYAKLSFLARRGMIVLIGVVLFVGTQSIFSGVPAAPPVEQQWGPFALQVNDQHLDLAAARAFDRQQQALVQDLLKIHATHIYSDYWTCNRLIFSSQERIICSVQDDDLYTGQNRYLPYHDIVTTDHLSSHVYRLGSPQATLFAPIAARSRGAYRRYIFDGYVVYQPVRPEK
jgi:hypothetical protein